MGRDRMLSRRKFPDNLYLNTNGYYYYRNPETKKKYGLGKDKAYAEREARLANAALIARQLTKTSLVDRISGVKTHTFKEWVDEYAVLWVESTKPAAATLRMAQLFFRRLTVCEFAHRDLADITTAHIAQHFESLNETSTPAMIGHLRARLSDMFRMAETKGYIEQGRNPVSATYVPKYEVARSRLSFEQFVTIRDASPDWFKGVMNLALLSAQRREDLAALKGENVRDGFLFVTQSKTGMKLQIKLTIGLPVIGMTLDDAVKGCAATDKQFLVRTVRKSKTGGVTPNNLTKMFGKVRDTLNLSWGDKGPATFHEIRSLSERMYKKEYGAEFAQAVLGHKSAKMTSEYDDLRGSGYSVVGE